MDSGLSDLIAALMGGSPVAVASSLSGTGPSASWPKPQDVTQDPLIDVKDLRKSASPRSNVSASLKASFAKQIIAAAMANGQDPATALAMAMQESRFSPTNTFNMKDPVGGDPLEEAMAFLGTRQKVAPRGADEAMRLQSFNGYGVLPKGLYGSAAPIDTRKDPVYGKRVIDLRESSIKKSQPLMDLIANFVNPPKGRLPQ